VKTAQPRELPPDLNPCALPAHVAVIMDGNGRWAKHRGHTRIAGHRRGADRLIDLLRCCKDWGIPTLTAYAFSTENWRRPKLEVELLMWLIELTIRHRLSELSAMGMRFDCIGDLTVLPLSLRREIERAIEQTADNTSVEFVMAINYGGRQDILQACQAIATEIDSGTINAGEVDQALFERHLYTGRKPNPDLLIRTSGEQRLSNFLLWQLAYTELYFTDTLWPDFDAAEFHRALLAYQARDRRFGRADPNPARLTAFS
jgi:undecaprenyl diphosphate synthase